MNWQDIFTNICTLSEFLPPDYHQKLPERQQNYLVSACFFLKFILLLPLMAWNCKCGSSLNPLQRSWISTWIVVLTEGFFRVRESSRYDTQLEHVERDLCFCVFIHSSFSKSRQHSVTSVICRYNGVCLKKKIVANPREISRTRPSHARFYVWD